MEVTHRGGCHCGAVRFEVVAPAQIEVSECNCSICSRSGHLHLIVPRERFRLISGEEELTTYRFGTGVARHLFCRRCGIKSFYRPRSHPDGVSVNARCLDEGTVAGTTLRRFDGRDWERAARERGWRPGGERGAVGYASGRMENLSRRLAELHAELEQVDALDAEARAALEAVMRDIREVLERAEDEERRQEGSLADRLREAGRNFEESHPTLTATLGRVVDALSALGI